MAGATDNRALEAEIDALHNELSRRGINSRGTTDIFGRPFNLPVNAEHKATIFSTATLFSTAQPHMRVFWAATFGFFCTFFSVFAPASLGPYLKKPKIDGGLDLSKDQLSLAGNLAVSGTVIMRVLAGPMCDMWGARKTMILLLMLGMPGMVVLMTAQGAASFILGRFMIGLSLATFVTCQVWCSQFFERRIVGTVNATAGGWGNVGGGITLLVMPQVMELFLSAHGGYSSDDKEEVGNAVDWSWRMCIIVPMALHLIAASFVYTGRYLADGSYAELETSGAKKKVAKGGGGKIALVGFSNTNALILMLGYGFCFGVELTMNNKLTLFFNRYYAQPPRTSSTLGASFSLMNLFARSWGGMLSDSMAVKYGIRGRITAMWLTQVTQGVMCIILGLLTINMLSPDDKSFDGMPDVAGRWSDSSGLDDVDYSINGTWTGTEAGYGAGLALVNATWSATGEGLVAQCGSDYITAPKWVTCPAVSGLGWVPCRFPVKGRVMVKDPNPDCIHNGGTLGTSLIIIIVFSIFVQMAEGLHFGVVPFVSRPALGVVSGMVGAGGNIGAVISGQFIIGSGTKAPLDRGFIVLGIVIIACSMLMHLIFFPGEGGILLPPNFPYDPQHIKPPADAVGSDELNFDNAVTSSSTSSSKDASKAAAVPGESSSI